MKNILLIEPNTALARLYKEMFAREGFEVVHVTSAQAAINAADAALPNLIILELQLPRHSGIEFLHEFRSYPEWWSVPIIVHTNITPVRMAPLQGALKIELGICSILYKPKTSLQALMHAVQEQLSAA